jgi:hypothetical protein
VKKNSFGLLKLEMADLERFWRKTPLGPLGVKFIINKDKNRDKYLFAFPHSSPKGRSVWANSPWARYKRTLITLGYKTMKVRVQTTPY